ncbi:hypothetical protein [Streptomyces triticiradicis]|uniref:hypothetical protein n=1 Tax=Streptomyces triticiradicis TaxID=2651189 RepID=UPI001788B0AB|nr:hypothetical protein [Streptomyces triticiradicis]
MRERAFPHGRAVTATEGRDALPLPGTTYTFAAYMFAANTYVTDMFVLPGAGCV